MSQCPNGAPPMFLPWTNVTVTLDQKAWNRGIGVSIGSPPQVISLRPSTSDYDLYAVNKAICNSSTNDTCIGSYGGVFDPASSSTFRQIAQGQWNGTNEPNPTELSRVYFNDVLTFGNATAYGFPAYFDEPQYGGQGVLPLGWYSDFLKTAFEIGAAPSKAFSVWTGSRSVDHPVDGSVVVGGYDSTRFVGTPTSFPSNSKCEFCVVVTGMSYDTVDGSTTLFSNSSESLQVSLNPSGRVLYVPQDMFENFATASNGTWDASLGNLRYSPGSPPTGNLTVTLKNGYKTTIPSEELFMYPRLYNQQGQYQISNDTVLIAEVLNFTNNGFLLDWGIPFLTMNYIIGDYANNHFLMAPAIRTDFQNQGGGYELEAICEATTTQSSTTSTTSASAKTSSAPTPVKSSGHSSDIGAIVGGAVGGVLGFLLIAGGLGLLFYRSRRRRGGGPANTMPEVEQRATTTPAPSSVPGAQSERLSHYTTTSPTKVGMNELSSDGHRDSSSVTHWLSGQDNSETTMSANVHRPFEMPTDRYDSE
ncbi:hypothetical protein LTR99_009139 [Exophiala xenobiotica]|uniref:Peptidase A1 domain-containing protein n=1 Tax=Vermiconidia calcicola TaxID=1690605 RepID=A0AAV9Q2R2_9PEZI|nr:hypothetical protein H2202_006945 [Exophiala xenobiotica]KAK5531645.1 hypothetical protein LTR23_009838 [Chaetothyriales sp. CCFEE 6169]KAK5532405.1 hypothetical protein LTR25_007938 [Vermiconidia calcicola]KAK5200341.1 hypothetical protein LTR92_000884 [Exophiala xenobiotica]KAK5206450.1 hypothetical protein LTR41_007888 [Exophiala xenobiotica]